MDLKNCNQNHQDADPDSIKLIQYMVKEIWVFKIL